MVVGVTGVEEVGLFDPEMTGVEVVVGVVVRLAVVGVVSLEIAESAACGADLEDAVVTEAVAAFTVAVFTVAAFTVAFATGVLACRASAEEAGTLTSDLSLSGASGDLLSLSLIFLM